MSPSPRNRIDMDLSAITTNPSLNSSLGPDVLTRWYIDTRPLASAQSPSDQLPLLETLQPADQDAVKAFYHLCDRQMSLASNLLKYLYVHRTCRVPWRDIVISRTPPPHRRPCYRPKKGAMSCNGDTGAGRASKGVDPPIQVEFNVSHQGYMVALAGCQVSPSMDRPPCDEGGNASPTGKSSPSFPQVGIDITCARDPTRRRAGSSNNDDDGQPKTEKDLQGFIDIFSEVFSDREIEDMKTRGTLAGRVHPAFMGSQLADCTSIEYRLRLFYTYWALKEAYIKMTGEALLAPWLRDLEFVDVEVPERPSQSQRKQSTSSLSRNGQMTPISPSSPSQPQSSSSSADDAHTPFGPPHETVAATLNGAKVDNVRLEVAAFESDYIFATAARGRGFGPESQRQASAMRWDKFRAVDIARDVAPCATGTCMCLL